MKKLNSIFFISLMLIFIINIMFIYGSLHIISPSKAYLLLIVIITISIFYFRNFKFPNIFRFYKSLSNFEKILLFFIIVIFITTLIRCFAPITGIDTLTARVNNPKRYIQQSGFENMPDKLGSNLPMGTEMLYLFTMLIFPDVSVNVIAFLISILTIFAIYNFSIEYFDKKIGFLAVVLVISTQVFYYQSWAPLQDMLLAFFSLVSLWTLLKCFNNSSIKYLIIFGIFAGTTIIVKANGAIFIFILYVLLFVKLMKTKKLSKLILPLLLTIIFYSPWLIKAYTYTGNPFYPYFNNFFKLFFPYNLLNDNLISGSIYLVFKNIVYYFTHFLNITILPIQINKYYSALNGLASPIILILFLCAIYKKFWKNKYLKCFIIIITVTYTFHFVLLTGSHGPRPRWIFIIFILFAFFGAWGYYSVKNKLLNRLLNVMIFMWVAFFTIYTTYKKAQTFPVIFGFQSKEEFHENCQYGFRPYADFKYLNDTVNGNEKVLLFDPRAYYLDPDYASSKNIYIILKSQNLLNQEHLYKYLADNNINYIWFDDDLKDQNHITNYLLLNITKEVIEKHNWKCIYINKKNNSYVYSGKR